MKTKITFFFLGCLAASLVWAVSLYTSTEGNIHLRAKTNFMNEGVAIGFDLGYDLGEEAGTLLGIKFGAIKQDNIWISNLTEIAQDVESWEDAARSAYRYMHYMKNLQIRQESWYMNDDKIKAVLND